MILPCNLAFYFLHNIRRIRKYLTHESTQKLVLALVIGYLDYCNSLFYGLPAMYRLHWLPVKYTIIYKVILITFKAMQGNAPRYISDLITFKRQSCYGLRSNNECYLGYPKERTNKTTGDRAFAAAAPALWNYLPVLGLRIVYLILNQL
jgi:hypothetical protein